MVSMAFMAHLAGPKTDANALLWKRLRGRLGVHVHPSESPMTRARSLTRVRHE